MTSIPTVDDFGRLEAQISELKTMLMTVMQSRGTKLVVDISDMAEIEGISRTQLVGKERYLLPNFGKSDFPDGTVRWNLNTVTNWRSIPVTERKRMYTTYLESVRKAGAETKKGAVR